jgi:ribonuclease III
MNLLNKIFKKNSRSKDDGIFFEIIKKIIGFDPQNLEYYKKGFTHRSTNKINDQGNPINYERLEFLGDAMLSAIVAAHLFKKAPTGDEGYLTKMRSKIVSRENLNLLGKELNLIQYVESKVQAKHFGENIHGNLFEALIGAIYLDLGYTFCEKFIEKQVVSNYSDIQRLEGKVISYKSIIIEWCQKEKKQFLFDVYDDNGIGGEKYFGVKLSVDGKVYGKSRATSKKKAEEMAAKRTFFALQEKIEKG